MKASKEVAAAILTQVVFQQNQRLCQRLERIRAEIPDGYRSENFEDTEKLAVKLVEKTYRMFLGRLSRSRVWSWRVAFGAVSRWSRRKKKASSRIEEPATAL